MFLFRRELSREENQAPSGIDRDMIVRRAAHGCKHDGQLLDDQPVVGFGDLFHGADSCGASGMAMSMGTLLTLSAPRNSLRRTSSRIASTTCWRG